MFTNKFAVILLMSAGLLASSCKTGLFGRDLPAAPPAPAPEAPVVVEGVRTSYADVVEKTSAAVVRIIAEGTTKPSAQTPEDDFFKQFGLPRGAQRPQIQRGAGFGSNCQRRRNYSDQSRTSSTARTRSRCFSATINLLTQN